MSKCRIAINGFGRIGRLTLRALLEKNHGEVEIVAINDLTANSTLAHLFKFDTAHGQFKGEVSATDTHIHINGQAINAYAIKDPAELPWKALNVDVVLECTGLFTKKEKAQLHIDAGAKYVLLSAPSEDDVPTVVLGVNSNALTGKDKIVSNASCTTNCLAPMVKVLEDNFGVAEGMFVMVHAYTGDQNLQDSPHKDLRRARAAALNIVPSSTGAAKAVVKVYPSLKDKLTGIAHRVPVLTGSLTDLTVKLKTATTPEAIKAAFKAAAGGELKNILEYSNDLPLVSSDIIGNPHSCIFDSDLTSVIEGTLVRVVGWYDNEAGYSNRLAELAIKLAKLTD